MYKIIFCVLLLTGFLVCQSKKSVLPKPVLQESRVFHFNSFVDCNMAEAWIGDTFRIFPGKYGEDPLWGYSNNLKFANGKTADEAFSSLPSAFTEPRMPPNVALGAQRFAWCSLVRNSVPG